MTHSFHKLHHRVWCYLASTGTLISRTHPHSILSTTSNPTPLYKPAILQGLNIRN